MHFVKPFTGDFEVAHLHEHIEIQRISDALLTKGFAPYIDFTLHGTTYYAGHIILEVNCIDEMVKQTAEQFLRDSAMPSRKEVNNALFQLACEEQKKHEVKIDLGVPLKKLVETTWLPREHLGVILAADGAENFENPQHSGAIIFHDSLEDFAHFLIKLSLPASYYREKPAEIALFIFLAYSFTTGILFELDNQGIGNYSDSDNDAHGRTNDHISYAARIVLSSSHVNQARLEKICHEFKQHWKELVIRRSHAWPQRISHDERLYNGAFWHFYDDYGLLISPAELGAVATPERIEAMIQAITCEFSVASLKNFDFSLG